MRYARTRIPQYPQTGKAHYPQTGNKSETGAIGSHQRAVHSPVLPPRSPSNKPCRHREFIPHPSGATCRNPPVTNHQSLSATRVTGSAHPGAAALGSGRHAQAAERSGLREMKVAICGFGCGWDDDADYLAEVPYSDNRAEGSAIECRRIM